MMRLALLALGCCLAGCNLIGHDNSQEATATSHYNRGLIYAQNGQTDDAISEFSAAVRDNPHDAQAYHNLALMLEKRGDLNAAISEFQGALAVDPNSEPTHLLLANAYAHRGDLAPAATEYQTALRLDQNDPRAHNNYGLLLRRRGNLKGAIAQYQTALFISPSDFAARVNLGVALYEQGDLGGASRELNQAILLRPDNPLPHDVLGFVLFELNKLDEALLQWQTAARLDPESADIAAALAIALWRKGNKPGSFASYSRALSLDHAYVCSDNTLRTQGYWSAAALAVLHSVREAAGRPACNGAGLTWLQAPDTVPTQAKKKGRRSRAGLTSAPVSLSEHGRDTLGPHHLPGRLHLLG